MNLVRVVGYEKYDDELINLDLVKKIDIVKGGGYSVVKFYFGFDDNEREVVRVNAAPKLEEGEIRDRIFKGTTTKLINFLYK